MVILLELEKVCMYTGRILHCIIGSDVLFDRLMIKPNLLHVRDVYYLTAIHTNLKLPQDNRDELPVSL